MRTAAALTILSGAALAAPESKPPIAPGGKDTAYGGLIYAPPVTVTITKTKTEYAGSQVAPPVTTTLTHHVPFDQHYADGYEQDDAVEVSDVITETKTFTLGDDEKTVELIHEWTITDAAEYAATVTSDAHIVWVTEYSTSIVWVDPTPESTSEPSPKPTKTAELQNGSGGLKGSQTTDKQVKVTEYPQEDEEPTDKEIYEAKQKAALKILEQLAKQQAANAIVSSAAPSQSASSGHRPARPHGPTPTFPHPKFHHPQYTSQSVATSTSESSTLVTKPKQSPSSKPASPQSSNILSPEHQALPPLRHSSVAPHASFVPQPSSPSDVKFEGEITTTPDGTCGIQQGGLIAYSCNGNEKGECCSAYGHCGQTSVHCGSGCQSGFGTCGQAGIKLANSAVAHDHGILSSSSENGFTHHAVLPPSSNNGLTHHGTHQGRSEDNRTDCEILIDESISGLEKQLTSLETYLKGRKVRKPTNMQIREVLHANFMSTEELALTDIFEAGCLGDSARWSVIDKFREVLDRSLDKYPVKGNKYSGPYRGLDKVLDEEPEENKEENKVSPVQPFDNALHEYHGWCAGVPEAELEACMTKKLEEKYGKKFHGKKGHKKPTKKPVKGGVHKRDENVPALMKRPDPSTDGPVEEWAQKLYLSTADAAQGHKHMLDPSQPDGKFKPYPAGLKGIMSPPEVPVYPEGLKLAPGGKIEIGERGEDQIEGSPGEIDQAEKKYKSVQDAVQGIKHLEDPKQPDGEWEYYPEGLKGYMAVVPPQE